MIADILGRKEKTVLEIYLGDTSNTGYEYCRFNDLFFNSKYKEINIDDRVKQIMIDIDGVNYMEEFKAQSKFGPYAFDIGQLSTGCKTAINVYSFPNIIFYTIECGENALKVIHGLDRGKIHMDRFLYLNSFHNDVKVHEGDNVYKIRNSFELEDALGKFYLGE